MEYCSIIYALVKVERYSENPIPSPKILSLLHINKSSNPKYHPFISDNTKNYIMYLAAMFFNFSL